MPIYDKLVEHSDLFILWFVFIAQFLIIKLYPIDPLLRYRKLAKQLAKKIIATNLSSIKLGTTNILTSIRTTEISIFILLWGTPIAMALAIEQFVRYPKLYQFILLFLALNFGYAKAYINTFLDALNHKQKLTCRQLLSYQLNRDTEQLSEIGLTKAIIEMIICAYIRNCICVIFFYIFFGSIIAFSYRLLTIIAHAWSPSQPSYQQLGRLPQCLLNLLEFIPLRIFALILFVSKKSKLTVNQLFKQQKSWQSQNIGALLAIIGSQLDMTIGGVVCYQQQRFVRPQLGTYKIPTIHSIIQLNNYLNLILLFWLLLNTILLLSINLINL